MNEITNKKQFISIGSLAGAVAKTLMNSGDTNQFQAERDAWSIIHGAVVEGKLHPLMRGRGALQQRRLNEEKDNYTDDLLTLDAAVNWGNSTRLAEFGLEVPKSMPGQAESTVQQVGDGVATNTNTLTDTRIAAIVEVATKLNYTPMAVKVGGKAAIETECLKTLNGSPCRFTHSTFKKAWQAARKANKIDVEGVGIYQGKQAANPHDC